MTSSSTPPTRPWRPTCASCRAVAEHRARGSGKEPLAEVLKALAKHPRRSATGWPRGGRPDPAGRSDAGPVRPGDVGLRRGHEFAVPDLKDAETLWKARDLVREYLDAGDAGGASEHTAKLESLEWPVEPARPT